MLQCDGFFKVWTFCGLSNCFQKAVAKSEELGFENWEEPEALGT
jgi:hypothetical protein